MTTSPWVACKPRHVRRRDVFDASQMFCLQGGVLLWVYWTSMVWKDSSTFIYKCVAAAWQLDYFRHILSVLVQVILSKAHYIISTTKSSAHRQHTIVTEGSISCCNDVSYFDDLCTNEGLSHSSGDKRCLFHMRFDYMSDERGKVVWCHEGVNVKSYWIREWKTWQWYESIMHDSSGLDLVVRLGCGVVTCIE